MMFASMPGGLASGRPKFIRLLIAAPKATLLPLADVSTFGGIAS
jgi:hypothetical protein